MPGSCERRHTVLVPCCSSTPPGLLMWTCLLLLLCYMEMWWGNKDSYLTKIIKSPGLSDLLLDTMHLILATRFICGFLHLVRNNLNRVTLNRRAFLCVSCVLTQSMRQWHHHVPTNCTNRMAAFMGVILRVFDVIVAVRHPFVRRSSVMHDVNGTRSRVKSIVFCRHRDR